MWPPAWKRSRPCCTAPGLTHGKKWHTVLPVITELRKQLANSSAAGKWHTRVCTCETEIDFYRTYIIPGIFQCKQHWRQEEIHIHSFTVLTYICEPKHTQFGVQFIISLLITVNMYQIWSALLKAFQRYEGSLELITRRPSCHREPPRDAGHFYRNLAPNPQPTQWIEWTLELSANIGKLLKNDFTSEPMKDWCTSSHDITGHTDQSSMKFRE